MNKTTIRLVHEGYEAGILSDFGGLWQLLVDAGFGAEDAAQNGFTATERTEAKERNETYEKLANALADYFDANQDESFTPGAFPAGDPT